MPNVSTIKGVTSAALAPGGTLVVSYPAGTTRGDFVLGMRHRLSIMGGVFNCPEAITVALGNTAATITYNGATTIPSGTPFTVELDRNTTNNPLATNPYPNDTYMKRGLATFAFPVALLAISLGTPTAAAATSVCAAQAIAGAASAVINGTKAANGAAPLGAPTGRNVNVVSSSAGDTTQVVTVTGTDMYGNVMREAITCNGTTTVQGKKAFYSVTGVAVSATMAGNLSVGDGTILGLPIYLANAVYVLKEIQDGAVATAGTIVAGLGIATPATATTGDVRGTYTPNQAPDGSKSCVLLCAPPEQNFYGQPQY